MLSQLQQESPNPSQCALQPTKDQRKLAADRTTQQLYNAPRIQPRKHEDDHDLIIKCFHHFLPIFYHLQIDTHAKHARQICRYPCKLQSGFATIAAASAPPSDSTDSCKLESSCIANRALRYEKRADLQTLSKSRSHILFWQLKLQIQSF